MAGHSKWANIKHRKEKMDAQKGKIFTKLAREIIVAAKEGGGDPNNNSRLRDAIEKAKAANMPNENIMRAIKKGTGELEGVTYEEITYEGYGPGGVAVLVEVMTDNKNRTAGEIRHIFDKHGGNLGASGCVAWMFNKKGLIIVEKDGKINEEELMMIAVDAGAEDFIVEEDSYEIITDPADFIKVRDAIAHNNISIANAEITMIPQNTVKLSGEDAEKMIKLIDKLEDHDDVQNVYHNFEISE